MWLADGAPPFRLAQRRPAQDEFEASRKHGMRTGRLISISIAMTLAACGDAAGMDDDLAVGAPATAAELTVAQALQREDGAYVVRGFLIRDGNSSVRLCEAVAESFPPQCGGSSLVVEGLDVGTIEGVQHQGNVMWVDDPISIRGQVADGVLDVAKNSE